jgi:cytochrome b561
MPSELKKPARDRYLRAQVVLHWMTAVLVLMQFVVNDDMRRAFRQQLGTADGDLSSGAGFHLVSGLLVLALTLARLAIRLTFGAPPPPAGVPLSFRVLASLVHWALYALLLLMPVTGAIAWFGRVETAAVLHETGRLFLLALILAHVFGAMVEHFVSGHRIIRRML